MHAQARFETWVSPRMVRSIIIMFVLCRKWVILLAKHSRMIFTIKLDIVGSHTKTLTDLLVSATNKVRYLTFYIGDQVVQTSLKMDYTKLNWQIGALFKLTRASWTSSLFARKNLCMLRKTCITLLTAAQSSHIIWYEPLEVGAKGKRRANFGDCRARAVPTNRFIHIAHG